MKIQTAQEYEEFTELMKQRSGANEIKMKVYVNNANETRESDFFFSFAPTMRRSTSEKYYKAFSFEIEEA